MGTGKGLDSFITEDEIQRAISQVATRKSPGPDGFLVEWYKLNVEFQSPQLITLFQ